VILSFALEFDSKKEMNKAAKKLWKKHDITGEMEIVRLDEGRWRLNVHSEKNLRDSTISKLAGKRVEVDATVSPGQE